MFIKNSTVENLTIKTFHINEHSEERNKIVIPKEPIMMYLVKQVGKNDKQISFFRGVIPSGKNYIIVNIYKNKKTNELEMKALTTLTEIQLKLSNNMNKGKQENGVYSLNISSINYNEMFFDYKEYEDYLNKRG